MYSEIRLFLEEYVFLHKTQLTEFVNAVEDLRMLDKTGYPCRECGQTFKFHFIRVKYVLFMPLVTDTHVPNYYIRCATAIAYMFLSCSYYYYYYAKK